MRLEVREHPKLGRAEWRAAGRARGPGSGEALSEPATCSTTVPRLGRCRRMSAISRNRCRAAVASANAAYTLARCSRSRTASHGSMNVHSGRARIPRVSWRCVLARSPRWRASRAAARECERRRRIVVQPVLVDDGEGRGQVVLGLGPLAGVHGQQASSDSVMAIVVLLVATSAMLEASANRALAWSASPRSRWASALSVRALSRQGLDSAPGRARTRVGQHLLGAVGAQERPQQRPGRLERRRAVRGHESKDAASTTPAQRCASRGLPVSTEIQPARTAKGGAPRRRRRRGPRATAPRSRSGLPHRSGRSAPPSALGTGPARSCPTGARARWPVIRWPRTSRRPAGAASR